MTVKFMFKSPYDASLLYTCTKEIAESPFGGEENIQVEIRRSKEYSESVLADFKSCISGLTECKYLGSKERISREVYQLMISSISHEVAFVFDKHEEDNIQRHIEIESPVIENPDFETRYNKTLEILKLALKDRISKDWKVCTWLIDDQSEMLVLIYIITFLESRINSEHLQIKCLFSIWGRTGLIVPDLNNTKTQYVA